MTQTQSERREVVVLQDRSGSMFKIPVDQLEHYRVRTDEAAGLVAAMAEQVDTTGFAQDSQGTGSKGAGSVSSWDSWKEGVYYVAYRLFWY